jgi:hypothetical protein
VYIVNDNEINSNAVILSQIKKRQAKRPERLKKNRGQIWIINQQITQTRLARDFSKHLFEQAACSATFA